jgi:hypothetical protein
LWNMIAGFQDRELAVRAHNAFLLPHRAWTALKHSITGEDTVADRSPAPVVNPATPVAAAAAAEPAAVAPAAPPAVPTPTVPSTPVAAGQPPPDPPSSTASTAPAVPETAPAVPNARQLFDLTECRGIDPYISPAQYAQYTTDRTTLQCDTREVVAWLVQAYRHAPGFQTMVTEKRTTVRNENVASLCAWASATFGTTRKRGEFCKEHDMSPCPIKNLTQAISVLRGVAARIATVPGQWDLASVAPNSGDMAAAVDKLPNPGE